VSADELVVDPVAAAHRLLGATLTGRGVRAIVVEVEAYGGVPDGPWPDASAH
jgi:DNA-3-methyladenine glycosylase